MIIPRFSSPDLYRLYFQLSCWNSSSLNAFNFKSHSKSQELPKLRDISYVRPCMHSKRVNFKTVLSLINDSSEFTTMYHHSLRQDVFIKEEYHYLNVPKVGTFTVYDSLDCTFECLGNPSCLSFNLAAYKGADGKLRCELLSSEKYSNPEEYKRNESFHHFSIKVG